MVNLQRNENECERPAYSLPEAVFHAWDAELLVWRRDRRLRLEIERKSPAWRGRSGPESLLRLSR